MTGKVGARPSEQALAVPATPAVAVDGPSGFDPSRVFVIMCSTGEYSDRSEWPIGYVRDERVAQRLVQLASEEWASGQVLHPQPEYPDDGLPWEEVTEELAEVADAAWKSECEKRDAALRETLTVDPDAVANCKYDEPFYFLHEVAAIATEAGTAATAKQGAVHEGAGPKDIAR